MKTTFVSSYAFSEATRLSLAKMQTDLVRANKELSTGRYADIGLALGHETSQTVSLRHDFQRLGKLIDTNSIVATRLDVTQHSLGEFVATAQDFLDTLIAIKNGDTGKTVARQSAQVSLKALIAGLNTSLNGEYIFAGINTDVRPITDYFQNPPGANKISLDTAFATAFGFAQGDPAAGAITGAAMQAFLDNDLAALFDPAGWSADWSSASDRNIFNRISSSQLVETTVNANMEGVRKLAKAYTMVADLGVDALNQEAFTAVVDSAIAAAGEAIYDLNLVRSNLGLVQARVADASQSMSLQIDILNRQVNTLESVDPFEAATRVNGLLTQIETSYRLTSRFQQLSLVNYL